MAHQSIVAYRKKLAQEKRKQSVEVYAAHLGSREKAEERLKILEARLAANMRKPR